MSSELCEEDVVQISSPQIISADALVNTLSCVSPVSAQRVAASSAAGDLGRRLLLAARAGDTQTVIDLMTKGAPFTTDWLGTSPLHLAAANGHVGTCAVLLRAGVTRDSRTKVERTPLHLAAHAGHAAVVALLLDHGAIVDGRDMLRMTPLHWAAARGHAEAARVLVERGAELRARCKFRHTPRALAARRGHADLALMLERAEAEADAAALTEQMAEEARKALGVDPLTGTTTTELKNDSSKSKTQQDATKQPKIDLKPEQQQVPSGEGAAAQLLRKHGITLLPTDDGSTVLNAIQSGRTVVLSDAGKLMLKESEVPSETEGTVKTVGGSVVAGARTAAAGGGGVVLRATPVRAPPRGVKVFSVNNRMLLPAAAVPVNKIPVKKVINPHDIQQMKFIQLSSETLPQVKSVAMKAKSKARPAPVKIIMNKSNFTKLIANANKTTVALTGAQVAAAAGVEATQPVQVGGTDSTVTTECVDPAEENRQLRAQLAAAQAALQAAAADLRAARDKLARYEGT